MYIYVLHWGFYAQKILGIPLNLAKIAKNPQKVVQNSAKSQKSSKKIEFARKIKLWTAAEFRNQKDNLKLC